MSVRTTADEELDKARDAVHEAVTHLSRVVCERVYGYDEFGGEFKTKMRESLDLLMSARDRLDVQEGSTSVAYNITSVDTRNSTLRISRENAAKARGMGGLPSVHPFERLEFGDDGYAPIRNFWWCGEGSGSAFDIVFEQAVALIEGDADLILTWEGGDSHSGVRIRNGKAKKCGVVLALEDE